MFGRLFPLIAVFILIAIFAALFNFSLPKIDQKSEIKKAFELSRSNTRNYVKSLDNSERQLLKELPCLETRCPDIVEMKKKFSLSYGNELIKRAIILDQTGKEIFSGRAIDTKYSNLISEAKSSGKAYYSEMVSNSGKDDSRLIIVQKISSATGNPLFENKFVLTMLDKSKFNFKVYRLIVGAIVGIPALFILLYFLIQITKNKTGKISASAESQNYASQIETLKRENVQQSQFLANFTHELRTPLNSIIGFSGLLKDQTLGNLGNPEYVKYANDINTSGAHLLSLINDILDYSKSEVGKLKVNMTEVDVVKVIKQSLSIVAPRASESKVELLQSFSNDYFIVRLDPKRLKQIMLNLLSNSVKFTPEGGSVMVSVFPDLKGEKVSIEVKDTGVGIAEKDIPTVMSLFGQVETDLNRKYEGTGIGLPFAKKLTTLMGGIFDLQSKVGVGTRVTLTFPFDKKLNADYAEMYKKSTTES